MKNSGALRVLAGMAVFVFSAALLTALGGPEGRGKHRAGTGEEAPRYFRDRNSPARPPQEHGGDENRVQETVRVTGRVRMVGSGPSRELVITGTAGEWHTGAQDWDRLVNLQQRVVTVEGKLESRDMILPNGAYAGTRLTLRDITVIHAE